MTIDVLRYAAFTDHPAGGNPAGVVLDARGLEDREMQDTATEVGYSETAFITSVDHDQREYRLRYFSPKAEVDFCGHATVATAVALAQRTGPGTLLFHTPVGAIPVEVTAVDGRFQATLTSVPSKSRPATTEQLHSALAALGWAEADLDPAFPPHVSFAGGYHLVLAAGTRDRLAKLDYDFDGLARVMNRHNWTTVHLVWREDDTRFHARDPFPVGGVVEDAATGAAAAAFGGYLRTLGRIGAPTRLTIRQGEDMGRPSELVVDVDPADAQVRVSGQAVEIG